MKLTNRIVFIIILVCSQAAYAISLKDAAAYPVPFNPKKKTLTIDNPPPAASLGTHKVILSIFDINGDLVIKKSLSAFPARWNGRSSSGNYVKPGLYIIKVEVDDDDGTYGKKIIRILVDY